MVGARVEGTEELAHEPRRDVAHDIRELRLALLLQRRLRQVVLHERQHILGEDLLARERGKREDDGESMWSSLG
jgi:hypothetical protein